MLKGKGHKMLSRAVTPYLLSLARRCFRQKEALCPGVRHAEKAVLCSCRSQQGSLRAVSSGTSILKAGVSEMKADGAQPVVFRQFFEKESCTYTYLLADADTREAILIDPVLETVDRDLRFVRELQLKLVYAVNTHCHADHVTGTGAIKRQVEGVKSGIASASKAQADVLLEPGDRIRFGAHELEVIATPGHTEGCICFYTLSGGGMVFTGDTLLVRGCGRTDFQGGSAEKLYDSVHNRLFTLPDTTRVFPAHDYKGCMDSTIGEEKVANPRLTKSKAEFVKLMGELGLDYPKQIDVALPANLICGVQD